MIWYLLISLFIIFLLWILLIPVFIYTNTNHNRYLLTMPGVFKAVVVPADDLFHIRGWVFFIPFRFNPFQERKRKSPDKNNKKKKSKKRYGNVGMITSVVRSVRVRRVELDIDTNDFILNAWLVPLFSMVNSEHIRMQVNFEGSASLILDLRVTLGGILWNFIKTKYNSFINL